MNKELLQKQIEELKAKVLEMEQELRKPEKFELKYNKNYTYLLNNGSVLSGCTGEDEKNLNLGLYRQSLEQAVISLGLNKKSNRLQALVEQCGGMKEFKVGADNYKIILDDQGEYDYIYNSTAHQIEVIYMDRQTATKVCKILNSKEYIL